VPSCCAVNDMDNQETLANLERLAELGGGEQRRQRQHAGGKLTARERMEILFDRAPSRRSTSCDPSVS